MPKATTVWKGKKKQIITAVVVVLLLVLAVGAGIFVQWLQHKGGSGGNKGAKTDTSSLGGDQSGALAQNSLPSSVKDAQGLAAAGNYDQSNKEISSSIASTSDNSEKFELYIQQGVNAENEGKYADALTAYKNAEKLQQTWAIYEDLGRASEKTGDKAGALSYYRKALSMVPSNEPLSGLEKNQLQANITNLGG